MLCKEDEWVSSCDVNVLRGYIVISMHRTGRVHEINLEEVREVTYEELFGKLILIFDSNGKRIEIQPQEVTDKDTVSKLILLLKARREPAIFDSSVQILKHFHRSVSTIFNLISELRETEGGFNWEKIAEISEVLADTLKYLKSSDHRIGSEVARLRESVSNRDIKEILSSAKSILVRTYDISKHFLAELLPGTCPDILLDLVLTSITISYLPQFSISRAEKRLKKMRELMSNVYKRFTNVMNIEDPTELESILQSTVDAEVFVDRIIDLVKKNLFTLGQAILTRSRRVK